MSPTRVVGVLFPGMTQLDLTGPAQVFAKVPAIDFTAVAAGREPVPTDCGFGIVPMADFDHAPQADVLLIPGGAGVNEAMADQRVLDFVRRQAKGAQVVASVCTGALVLGAAGLLRGKRVTTHWASMQFLEDLGAVPVSQRVVEDAPLFTCAGVLAGIDLALRLVERVAGEEEARRVQLHLEYDPEPPFDSGNPTRVPRQWVFDGELDQRVARGSVVAEAARNLRDAAVLTEY
jgi:cyclohexyl-isocyanide hydratase